MNNRKSILSVACSLTATEGRPADLSDDIGELGKYIEQNFFDDITTDEYSITVVRRDDEKWACHDEEAPPEWCGRYFVIGCENHTIKAFVGWFYGGGSGGKYRKAPRFVVQIDKDAVRELSALNSFEWHEEEGWMNKEIAGDLSNVQAVATEFKRTIKALCEGGTCIEV
ncbi:MAG: hypothetical protein IJ678_08350 [Kiritimatiellae bacterium]|nr:hypothetical protein [Kiritimatiellia bacterium]